MFNYFFTLPIINTPAGTGFGLFSIAHLIALVLLAAMVYLIVTSYKKADEIGRSVIRKTIAFVLVLSDLVLREFVSLIFGAFDVSLLPLHICGLGMFVVLFDAFKPSRFTRSVLYGFTLWAAVAALIFADWSNHPIFNIFTLQSFVFHALLVAYVWMLLASGELVPSFSDIKYNLIFLFGGLSVAMVANNFLGTNFWFISSGSKGSPLEAILNLVGENWFIPVLILLLFVLWAILYIPWQLDKNKKTVTV